MRAEKIVEKNVLIVKAYQLSGDLLKRQILIFL